MGDLSKCLPITLQFEGGWSDNPKDPGGATMNGITLATFRRYRPNATAADLRAISPEVRQVIYADGYWKPISGDNLPSGVDLAAFDYAVNSGVGAANKALAASAGLPPVDRVKAICARRLSILQGLKTWAYFGKGWGARVAQVMATGIKWAAASPAEAKTEIEKAAAAETKAAKTKTAASASSAAAGASVTAAGQNEWALIAVGVVLIVIAILVAFTIRKHQDAADALTSAAKGI
jgi:lysozyme family protein